MVELEIFSSLITFSDLSLYRPTKFSAPPFSDSDIRVENFLENAQKFYDIGARSVPLNLTPIDLLRKYQDFLSRIFHLYTKHMLSSHLQVQPYLLLLKLSSTKKSSILILIGNKVFMHIHLNRKTLWKSSHWLNGSVTEWKPMGSDDDVTYMYDMLWVVYTLIDYIDWLLWLIINLLIFPLRILHHIETSALPVKSDLYVEHMTFSSEGSFMCQSIL
jgi:hypothetical protein